MKMSFLVVVAVAGICLAASASVAQAHDPFHQHHRHGHHGQGYDYRFRPGVGYGGGYFRPVPRNQVYILTPGLSIGFGGPAYRHHQPRGFYAPYGQGFDGTGCGW
ncbi:MAG: hypothetical protein EHM42_06290 [Planctomycetaceae bacterium]|nr:MAG: hypothetical protein EHM42_06290 [Planctomycetaceae bacterium]